MNTILIRPYGDALFSLKLGASRRPCTFQMLTGTCRLGWLEFFFMKRTQLLNLQRKANFPIRSPLCHFWVGELFGKPNAHSLTRTIFVVVPLRGQETKPESFRLRHHACGGFSPKLVGGGRWFDVQSSLASSLVPQIFLSSINSKNSIAVNFLVLWDRCPL